MNYSRIRRLVHNKRAQTMLGLIGFFWLWVWVGGAALIEGLHHHPVYAALALYALAVTVLVSPPAALLIILEMIITHPRYMATDTATLPNVSGDITASEASREVTQSHWWYDREAV